MKLLSFLFFLLFTVSAYSQSTPGYNLYGSDIGLPICSGETRDANDVPYWTTSNCFNLRPASGQGVTIANVGGGLGVYRNTVNNQFRLNTLSSAHFVLSGSIFSLKNDAITKSLFADEDWGHISVTGNIVLIDEDAVSATQLADKNRPADEQCLTYEASTSNFEWQNCVSLADDSITKDKFADEDWGDMSVRRNVVTVDNDAINRFNLADEDWGDVRVSNNFVTIEDDIITRQKFANNDWGDMTVSNNLITLDPNTVNVNELYGKDSPNDEECLTYEHSTRNLEWQTCARIDTDSVGPSQLNDSNTPVDEYCLTFEAASNRFEWQSCDPGGAVIFPDSITKSKFANEDWGEVSVNNNIITIDNNVIDVSNLQSGDFGDLSLSGGNLTIDRGVVGVVELDDKDTPADEECLTYEADTRDFEWQSCSSIGANSIGVRELDNGLDTPNDEECLTYEDSSETFEWQACGTGGGGGVAIIGNDSITVENFATQDWGDINVFNNNVRLDPDVVNVNELDDGTDTPADEECLTYEADTQQLEWQSCDISTFTIPDDSITKSKFANEDWGDISVSSNNVSIDANTISATEIQNDAVNAFELNDINTPVDEYCLTFEQSLGRLEWQACLFSITIADNSIGRGKLTPSDFGDFSITAQNNALLDADTVNVAELDDIDTPSDEECLTYESSTARLEWQSCGTTSTTITTNSIDNTHFIHNRDWGEISVNSTGSVLIDEDAISKSNFANEDWGEVSVSSNTVSIDRGVIDRTKLKQGDFGDISVTSSNQVLLDANTVSITEIDDANTATDEYCLTYEASTSNFEWQACGTSSTIAEDSITKSLFADEDWGDMTVTNNVIKVDENAIGSAKLNTTNSTTTGYCLQAADDRGRMNWTPCIAEDSVTKSMFANEDWGDILVNNNVVSLDQNTVNEAELNVANSPTDEYCLTFEASSSRFEWQACGGTATLSADTVGATELDDLNNPRDEYCLTYESTGDRLEWQSCANLGTSVIANDTITSAMFAHSQDWGEIITTSTGVVQLDNDFIDSSNFRHLTNFGDITTTGSGTFNINQDTISARELNDGTDTPVDEECLTFESTGNRLEWQTCGSGGSVTIPDNSITVNKLLTGTLGNGADVEISVGSQGKHAILVTDSVNYRELDDGASTPRDEYCLTYEADHQNLEWQACGQVSTLDIPDNSVTRQKFNPENWGDMTVSNTNVVNLNARSVGIDELDDQDNATDEECLTYESSTNKFEWQSCGTTPNLVEDSINVRELDDQNRPTDEYCLTYEADTQQLEWQGCKDFGPDTDLEVRSLEVIRGIPIEMKRYYCRDNGLPLSAAVLQFVPVSPIVFIENRDPNGCEINLQTPYHLNKFYKVDIFYRSSPTANLKFFSERIQVGAAIHSANGVTSRFRSNDFHTPNFSVMWDAGSVSGNDLNAKWVTIDLDDLMN